MKALLISAIVASWLAASSCAGPYQQTSVAASYRTPDGGVDVSYFYDALSPYGRWIDYTPYGWCWTPYDVASDWRPYGDGTWVYTDYGWSWATSEPWGWATYHYGRWFFDTDYGWVWVPGSQWGPAWVAWRASDDWVGWAPLPPAASWSRSVGLQFGDATGIPASRWCFVPRRSLVDSNLRLQITSVARNGALMAATHDATRFDIRDGRPVDRGVDVWAIEKAARRAVPHRHVEDATAPARGRGQVTTRGTVAFFRPQIHASPGAEPRWEARRRRPEDAGQAVDPRMQKRTKSDDRARTQGRGKEKRGHGDRDRNDAE